MKDKKKFDPTALFRSGLILNVHHVKVLAHGHGHGTETKQEYKIVVFKIFQAMFEFEKVRKSDVRVYTITEKISKL